MVKEVEMESQIELALSSRIQHFKNNADSLTLGTVRRLLEKDIGLQPYALDAHKKFIKALVEKLLEDSNDVAVDSGTKVELPNSLTKESEPPKTDDAPKGLSEIATEDDPKMEDSPVMGLMTNKTDLVDPQSTVINEQKIGEAVWDRASHIRDNSETITMISLRRLLEEDMALPTYSLDPFKSFIRSQIDEVLESSKVSKPPPITKKAKTPSLKNISETKSSSAHDKIKSRKRDVGSIGNNDKARSVNKRKEPQKETQIPNKKQKKSDKSPSDEGADNMDVDSDLHSESSDGKNVKAKQVSTPAYGKRVESLKSIIKACGMGIAPTVYKRAKQVSDEEREAFVIKELLGILSREGLSANPTEKEIKEVKRKKDKEKELEGIDLSNIVTSSRRRSTNTYMPPARVAKPKLHVESESDESKSAHKNENDEDESDDVNSSKKKVDQDETNDAESMEKEKKMGNDADDVKGSKQKEEQEEQEVDGSDQEEGEDEDDNDVSESEDSESEDSESEEFAEDEECSD